MPLKLSVKPQGPRQHIQSINDVLTFGKHNGVTVEDVLHDEPGYFDWLFEKNIITSTPEMQRIIDDAILKHADDWEDIPF